MESKGQGMPPSEQPPPYPTSEPQFGGNFNTAYSAPVGDNYDYSNSYPPTQPQLTVITHQPTLNTNAVHAVPDYFGLAVFVTICCCWPIGLVALSKARESREALLRNDIAGAHMLAEDSKRMSIYSIVFGVIILGAVIGLSVALVNSRTTYYS